MGAGLVGATFDNHWSTTLTANERLILVAMALSALDTPSRNRPAMRYYGGEEALVIALDGDLPDPGTPAYRTRTKAVGKLVAELIRKGAIHREEMGRRGTRSVYLLTLDSHQQPTLLDDPQPVDNVRPLQRKGGGQHPPKWATNHPPNSKLGG